MLIDRIRGDMISARKGSDAVSKSLLVTLYSEASRVGKDKRNGSTTDDECVAVIRRFITNAQETARLLSSKGLATHNQQLELTLLESYLPSQLSADELQKAVVNITAELSATGTVTMGAIMAALKQKYAGRYDGKTASAVVRDVLN